MKIENEKIIVISAHSDDMEHCCGGSISELSKENEIYHAVFSFAEESIPEGYNQDSTREEFKRSMKILNIDMCNVFTFNYPVRRFPEYRQNILEDLIKIRNDLKPTVVFTHSLNDMHQDHKTIAEESFRAFKISCNIISYNNKRNCMINTDNFFISLNEENVKKKLDALNEYKSQICKYRYYDDMIRSELIFNGSKIGTKYAESFELIRMYIK